MYGIGLLKGLTLKEVARTEDSLSFETECGRSFQMYHSQDCCESVVIDDICGDVDDLIGTPILVAEERESEDAPEGCKNDEYGSNTWTFYTLRTIKGSVDIRWHGTSNGYYSESVSFMETTRGRES